MFLLVVQTAQCPPTISARRTGCIARHSRAESHSLDQASATVTPMERAVPLTMLIAASMLAALRSGIFFSAISRTWAWVSWPTLVLFGLPLPDSMPSAFLMRTGTGGVLVMKVKERSE